MNLLDLPEDILFVIFSFCGLRGLHSIFLSCRKLNQICQNERFWKKLVEDFSSTCSLLPTKPVACLWKDYFRLITRWRWCHAKKSEFLVISNELRTLSRPTRNGTNPAALAEFALHKQRNSYSVLVDNFNDWISIGLAPSIRYEGGGVFGERGSLESCYFCQGPAQLKGPGSVTYTTEKCPAIKTGDKMTVILNFKEEQIEYYLNGKLIGFCSSVPKTGIYYPAVGMAYSCSLTFIS